MKYILIIGDGMADNPLEALGGLTPLDTAKKPEIDALAARGIVGSVRNVPEGFPPGSDTAIMSIFGATPKKYYSGRAPLEAAAQGIRLQSGDAAFRCNNVGLSDGEAYAERVMLSHSAGGVSGEESRKLIEDLFADPEFKALADRAGMRVCPANSYRHLCIQAQTDITGLKLFPPHDNLNKKVKDIVPQGNPDAETLLALMAASAKFLDRHPINEARRKAGKLAANSIWFWAEGTAATLPNFFAQYGKTGAVISAVPLCHGIAKLVGLDVILVEGANGEWDTNYEGKVAAALEALQTRDFVAVHLEGPDECTHNGDLKGKLQAIEWLSSRVTAPLTKAMEERGEPYRLLLLSDHKTLMDGGLHDGDPVPYLLYDSRELSQSGKPYTEKAGLTGPMLDDGAMLMSLLFEQQ